MERKRNNTCGSTTLAYLTSMCPRRMLEDVHKVLQEFRKMRVKQVS